jgi:hypothetical protein
MSDGEHDVDSYIALLNELVMLGISCRQAYFDRFLIASAGCPNKTAFNRVDGTGGCQEEQSRRLHSG